MKHRLRIRLHRKLYDALELEVVWQDSRIGTLTNRILQEEFARLQSVAPDCILCGADEGNTEKYSAAAAHPEQYYVLPSLDCREKYMPTHSRGLDTKGQVTLLVTDAQLVLLDALFERECDYVRGVYSESVGRTVKSYRYQLVGLLLHNPLLQELQTM